MLFKSNSKSRSPILENIINGIILNINEILNFKAVNYKKIIINNGTLRININNINKVLKNINKNKKKLIFKKNKIIFLHKKKIFFEISDALIRVNNFNKKII